MVTLNDKILQASPLNGEIKLNELSTRINEDKKKLIPALIKLKYSGYLRLRKPFLGQYRIKRTDLDPKGANCRILTMFNLKGGVGKTVISFNLSASLAEQGKNVLLVDLDPQANLSGLFAKSNIGLYELMNAAPTQSVIKKSGIKNLDFIPSGSKLANIELELVSRYKRESVLSNFISEIRANYDYIIFDCHPSISLLTVNALVASDGAVIPCELAPFGLQSVEKSMFVIDMVSKRLNRRLKCDAIILNKYFEDNLVGTEIEEKIRKKSGKSLDK